jgi:hypothetical protein
MAFAGIPFFDTPKRRAVARMSVAIVANHPSLRTLNLHKIILLNRGTRTQVRSDHHGESSQDCRAGDGRDPGGRRLRGRRWAWSWSRDRGRRGARAGTGARRLLSALDLGALPFAPIVGRQRHKHLGFKRLCKLLGVLQLGLVLVITRDGRGERQLQTV